MQIWFAPGRTKDFSPFTLHRTYTGQYDDTVSIDWSSDSRYIIGLAMALLPIIDNQPMQVDLAQFK